MTEPVPRTNAACTHPVAAFHRVRVAVACETAAFNPWVAAFPGTSASYIRASALFRRSWECSVRNRLPRARGARCGFCEPEGVVESGNAWKLAMACSLRSEEWLVLRGEAGVHSGNGPLADSPREHHTAFIPPSPRPRRRKAASLPAPLRQCRPDSRGTGILKLIENLQCSLGPSDGLGAFTNLIECERGVP